MSSIEFRLACRQFATGVTVVTVIDGDRPRGMTANTFTAISLEPPLIMVAILRSARTHELMDRGGRFAISILAEEHRHWSDRFAGRHGDIQDQFDDVPHWLTSDGLPVVQGSLAHVVCRVEAIYSGGDHSLFLGRVEEIGATAGPPPLLYYDGAYRSLGSRL